MTCHTSLQDEPTLHYNIAMNEQPQKHPSDNMPSSKKSVSFYPMAEVKLVLHIDEYSDAELQACWYSVEEIKEIKRLNKYQADIHRVSQIDPSIKNILDDPDEFTERGLEHHIFLSTHEKLQNCKRHAMHLVLQEQYFAQFNHSHSADGEGDDEELEEAMFALAQSYKRAAFDCRKYACLRGVEDARAAKKCWETPEKCKPSEMPMVQFVEEAPVERKSDKPGRLGITPRPTAAAPTNFLQKLARQRCQVYSLAA